MSDRERLVLIDGHLRAAPVDTDADLRCIARTRTGQRCRLMVLATRADAPPAFRERLLWSTRGLLTVLDLGGPDDLTRAWTGQHCRTHDTPDAVDATAVEWRPFDAEADTAMIDPVLSLPRRPGPDADWCPVPGWLSDLWWATGARRPYGYRYGRNE
jgi:hypothetical protein